jgi:hypothetical protein
MFSSKGDCDVASIYVDRNNKSCRQKSEDDKSYCLDETQGNKDVKSGLMLFGVIYCFKNYCFKNNRRARDNGFRHSPSLKRPLLERLVCR